MIPTRENLIARLYAELDARTGRLPITLGGHNEITGIANHFNATLDFSCVFEHPDRTIEVGFNCPPRKALLQADTEKFAKLSYKAKEAFLRKAGKRIGVWFDEYDPPWTLHAEGRSPDEALERWLEGRYGGDSPDEAEILIGLGPCDEHLPGFAILDHMAQTDVHRLRMKEVDVGGPVSAVYAVAVDCSIQDLNEALRRNDLPFEAVEATHS